MILKNQQMEIALGLPVAISGFKDGKIRYCKPYTLEYLPLLNLFLSSFSNTDLYSNFQDENKTLMMASFFAKSFDVQKDEDMDTLLHAIDDSNFEEIVKDIKEVNGIIDKQGEVDINKSTSTIDWETSINVIPVYTSISHEKVKDMTLRKFNKTLELIGKKINYEYKSNTIGLVKNPSEYISESDHPMYSAPKVNGENKITMDSIQELMKLAQSN